MTLGGLALAVGILVDDATVEIENIHRNLAMGKTLKRAILDGAQQIAVPAFVATTAISIVFLCVLFLEGAARYLFMGMAMAVGFSVMASYFLSRTVIPTLVMYLLKDEVACATHGRLARDLDEANASRAGTARPASSPGSTSGSSGGSRASATLTSRGLEWALRHRKTVFATFARRGDRRGGARARSSGATSSRRSTPGRSACTSPPRRARASRRRRSGSPRVADADPAS